MARFQRSRFQPQTQVLRRKFDWIGGVASQVGLTQINAATSIIESAFDTRTITTTPNVPFTIVRVRGRLQVMSDQTVGLEGPIGAFGMCVVNGEAFDAGVASVPTPWTESNDHRWFYHQYFGCPLIEDGTSGEYQQLFTDITIDGKAMRKINTNDVILSVLENQSIVGMRFWSNFRMGIKLH